jgi:NAD-dependent dihydropyrimidine dehydrogenase PreA subunit
MAKDILPIINLERCDRCGVCIAGCPENALTMTDQGPSFIIPVTCTYCTDCEALCPQGAIRTPFTVVWAPES